MTSHEELKSLVKLRTNIEGEIMDVHRIETGWNKNMAVVISCSHKNYGDIYEVFLLVYEPSQKSLDENLLVFPNESGYTSVSYWGEEKRKPIHLTYVEAIQEKEKLIKHLLYEVNGTYINHPILLFHVDYGSKRAFEFIVQKPFTRTIGFTFYDDPRDYLKAFDIVEVSRETIRGDLYTHFGIYINKNKVIHFSDPNGKKIDSRDTNRIVCTNGDEFLEGTRKTARIFATRTSIPFRNYREISTSIAYDVQNEIGKGRYCLANFNCEHYANQQIFGLKGSEQAKNREDKIKNWARGNNFNNGVSKFKLSDELRKYHNVLDDQLSQEIERQYLQEIPPKQDCRIM